MRRLRTTGVLLAAGLLAAACSSSSSSGGSSGGGSNSSATSTVTISNEAGQLWSCGFSPYNGSTNFLSTGFVYEPLVFVNPLQNGKTTPMLATAWTWGAGNKSLTFTIRKGVKFNNGTAMTPADVVFTFNMLKKFPALDLPGDWAVLSSVSQTGSDQVTMTFKAPAVPYFYYIAGQTPIVPAAVWSKLANPVTYSDPHPVGTGPYMVNPCTGQNITYTANPHFWQPGLPQHQEGGVPRVHVEQHGQRPARERPGAVGLPVHPEHQGVLHLEEPGQPLLVPADRERLAGAQPDQPAAGQRQGPAGHVVRDRPGEGLLDRRIRVRAAREPERHRHADLLQLARQLADQQVQLQLQPREGEGSCWPRPASSRAPTASW